MITTVTLNAAIDKTYYLNNFVYSSVMRVKHIHSVPGGKGINVARVIHQLGGDVLTTGFIGGKNGEFIENELTKQGIRHDFIKILGESRLCLNIIDESNGTSTELLEPGPEIKKDCLIEMKKHISNLSKRSKVLVFSGSLPIGSPFDFYHELIQISKSEGAKVFLDTSGEALIKGIESHPFLIKPNKEEVSNLLKSSIDQQGLYMKIKEMNAGGIACVVVSLGAEGALVGYAGCLYRIKAPLVSAVNTVGCGDAFMAGMAFAYSKGDQMEDCLKYATAVGAANALTYEAGNIRKEDVRYLVTQVQIENICGSYT